MTRRRIALEVYVSLYASIIANPLPLIAYSDRANHVLLHGIAPLMRGTAFDGSQDQALQKQVVIAVVDDDTSVREALTGLMKSLGYCAVAFQSAEDFLDSKQRHVVACLIADVQMPGMTGPDLHAELVTTGQPIPTILITAFPEDGMRTRALQAGVECYLTKPFSEADLLTCLHAVLDHRATEERGT